MSYPLKPTVTGSLVVGYFPIKTWLELTPGSDGQILKANALATEGLEWSDSLGIKTFESDLTLTDLGPGVESTVFRTNASGATSIVNTDSAQTIYFGGHTAASSLQFNLTGSAATWIPSSTRSLAYSLNAARTFSILHGSTSLEVQAGSVRSYREHRFYSPDTLSYATLSIDNSGNTFFTSTDVTNDLWFGDGTTTNSMRLITWPGNYAELRVPTGLGNLQLEAASGRQIIQSIAFGLATTRLTSTSFTTNVPGTFGITDAVLNNVSYGVNMQHGTTGGAPLAGFGSGAQFQMHDSARIYRTAAAWEVLWEDPTSGTHDGAIRFRTITNGSYATNNLLYLSGGAVSGSYGVGIDTNAPTRLFDVNGNVRFRGSPRYARVSKTTTYSITINDYYVDCDTSGGAFTVTLPTLASVGEGHEVQITDATGSCGTNALTIDGNGAETINGAASIDLVVDYDALTLYAGASEWKIK